MKIILGDTETASLKKPEPPATGVVQVAWLELVKSDTGRYVEAAHHCALIDPGIPIEPGAQKVHGIDDDMVLGAPKLFDVFNFQEPVFFIAHNRAFDLSRLAEGMENMVGSLCTLMAARRFCKDAPNHKLGTLVEHYGLPKFEAHDALGDTRMTLGLLNYIIEKSDLDLLELAHHVDTPKVPEKMPFGKYRGSDFRDLPSDYIVYMLGLEDLDQGVRTALNMQRRLRGNDL